MPRVIEMQAEGGAAGAVHGALQAGSLTTTFTASQGLLLMIPNMYKIAGELTPHGLSHCRTITRRPGPVHLRRPLRCDGGPQSTGWGMLFANSVQEVMDFALISQAATLKSRIPFLHILDGFRTSHEIQKIEKLSEADILALIDEDAIRAHRSRGLSPDNPFIRGTAQNPDVYFQGRESVNPFYLATPGIVQETMDAFAKQVGRTYRLFDYVGAPDAERVIVMMGSGCEAAEETIDYLTGKGEKVGLVKVRLYRPFSSELLVAAIPKTARFVAVLDRTKEPGASGEPLYQDVVTAVAEDMSNDTPRFTSMPRIIGGRYGLSSKEFTPAHGQGRAGRICSDASPKNHFTVGIVDDVSNTSITYSDSFRYRAGRRYAGGLLGPRRRRHGRCQQELDQDHWRRHGLYAQGYFVYDSQEVRRPDDITSAIWAASHPQHVPDREGAIRGCPSVRLS